MSSANVDSFRDTLAKPTIKLTAKEFFSGAGHLLSHYGRTNSSAIERGLERREGNVLKFPLPQYGGEAGEGLNLRRNSTTKNEHGEITSYGHLNYGVDFNMDDTTYETQQSMILNEHSQWAGDAMARKAVQRYMRELVHATNFVAFNPGNPGLSLLAIRAKMRRMGAMSKPNIVYSTGMWTAIENVKHANTNNMSIPENLKNFNIIDDVNGLPTYKTGNRTGLCLKVYSGCQSGCQIYISGGADAAGLRIIRKGEVIEFCGTQAIDELSHISRGERRQFIVQCDVWADSTGKAAVQIEPELRPLQVDYSVGNHFGQQASFGGRKNVTNSPKDGVDVYVSPGLQPNSEYEQSIIWYDEMMVKIAPDATTDREFFSSRPIRSRIAGNLGNMMFSKQYNIQNTVITYRWDWNIDYLNLYPEMGFRMVGNKVAEC